MKKCSSFVLAALASFGPLAAHAQIPIASPAAESAAAALRIAPTVAAARVWALATLINGFTQRDPNEGLPASEGTEVWIAYDNEAIYVGARLRDRGEVTSRLGRRDMTLASSDWFRVSFDSYHDRRIGVRFDVNPDQINQLKERVAGARKGLTGAANLLFNHGPYLQSG